MLEFNTDKTYSLKNIYYQWDDDKDRWFVSDESSYISIGTNYSVEDDYLHIKLRNTPYATRDVWNLFKLEGDLLTLHNALRYSGNNPSLIGEWTYSYAYSDGEIKVHELNITADSILVRTEYEKSDTYRSEVTRSIHIEDKLVTEYNDSGTLGRYQYKISKGYLYFANLGEKIELYKK